MQNSYTTILKIIIALSLSILLVPKIQGQSITSFSPTQASVGDVITITGTGFTGIDLVQIGDQNVKSDEFTVVNSTTITCFIPKTAKTGRVKVGTHGASTVKSPNNLFIVAKNTSVTYTLKNATIMSAGVYNAGNGIALADFDGDGRLDVIEVSQSGDGVLHYEQDDMSLNTFTQTGNNFAGISSNHVSTMVADIDNDGLLEIFVTDDSGNITRLEQDAPNSLNFISTTFSYPSLGSGFFPKIASADIDNDGLLDILVTVFSAGNFEIRHLEQQSSTNLTNFITISSSLNGMLLSGENNPYLADIDGDNLVDLLIGQADGTIARYEQNTANSYNFTSLGNLKDDTGSDIDAGGNVSVFVTDIDADGLVDLIINDGQGSGTGKRILHYEQTNSNTVFPGGINDELQMWLKADTEVYTDRNGNNKGSTNATDGDNVQSWGDLSGNRSNDATNIVEINPPRFRNNTTQNINYNPVIQFGNNRRALSFHNDYIQVENGKSGLAIIAVVKPSTTGEPRFVYNWGGFSGNGVWLSVSTNQYRFGLGGGGNQLASHTFGSQVTLIGNQTTFSGNKQLFVNATPFASSSANSVNRVATNNVEESFDRSSGGPITIGGQSKSLNAGVREFQGEIAEIMFYSKSLPNSERARIESYLAIKYGITLNNGTLHYLASDGTIIWNNVAGASHNNNIAVIARDDNSGLNQKQSKSINSDAIVGIGLGTIATTNSDNSNTFPADLRFLSWGHDGGDATFASRTTSSLPTNVTYRMTRVWKVQELLGDVGNVELEFDLNGLGFAPTGTYVLLQDNIVPDWSDATVSATATAVGGIVKFSGINLSDAEHFTLAAVGMATNLMALSPGRNALNVNINSNIAITFPQDIDNSTVTTNSFKVIGEQSGLQAGTFNTVNNVVTFNPSNDFIHGEKVTVILTQNIFSLAGTSLSQSVVYQFIVNANTGPATFIENEVTNLADTPFSVRAAYINGDATLDIVMCSGQTATARIAWYDGTDFTETIVANSSTSPSIERPTDIRVADLDNDGDMDIITRTETSDRLIWFANNGSGSFTIQTQLNSTLTNPVGLGLGDLDGDGDIDVVTGSTTQGVYWYRNNGSGSFTEIAASTILFASTSGLSIADLDNDGQMDIVVPGANSPNALRYLRNEGSASSFTLIEEVSTGLDISRYVYNVDLDEDGDIDIIVPAQNTDNLAWFANDGAGNFTQQTPDIATGLTSIRKVLATDIDGDNDLDLLVTSPSFNTLLFINDGSENFTQQEVEPNHQSRGVYPVDLDGDGDMDFLSAESVNDRIVFYENATPATALNFDGTDDFVSVPHDASLNFGTSTDFTIEAWIKYTGSATNYSAIVAKAEPDPTPFTTQNGYQMQLFNNRVVGEIMIGTSTTIGISDGLIGSTPLNDGVWHHLAMVVDRSANNVRLYVDGNIEAEVTSPIVSGDVNSTDNLFIGVERESTYFFGGSIDEVRVWNVARTCNELNEGMNCELAGSEANLVAYYTFNQGELNGTNTGLTTLTDASSSGFNGTLNNFTLSGTSSNWVEGNTGISTTACTFAGVYPEITITGNAVEIVNGDITPDISDDTDFGLLEVGSTLSRTFTITNTGTADLDITSVGFTGSGEFSQTGGTPVTLTAGNSTTFGIDYNPVSIGTQTITVEIYSNDCDEPVYTFDIQGYGLPAPPPGNALNFGGANDQIDLGSIADTDPLALAGSNFTISAWINTDFTGDIRQRIIDKSTALLATDGYALVAFNDASIGIMVDGLLRYRSDANTVSINTWNHVAITGDGSTYKAFVNGIEVSGTASGTYINPPASTANMKIGNWNSGFDTRNFDGSIDELRIWNVARSETDIQADMNSILDPTTHPNLLAYYRFDLGNANADNTALPNNELIDEVGCRTGILENFTNFMGSFSNWVNTGTDLPPILTTYDAYNITGNTADIDLEIFATGIISGVNQYGVCYSTSPCPTIADATISTSGTFGTGTYTMNLTGLTDGMVYYARAYAYNASMSVPTYGETIILTTPFIPPGNALSFDGVDDEVDLGDVIEGFSAVTFEAWVNPSAYIGVGHGEICSKEVVNSFSIDQNGFLHFNLGDGSAWLGGWTSSTVVPLNTWTHVSATWDGSTVRLYINGVLDLEDSFSGTVGSNTSVRGIGGKGFTGFNVFTGKIDELRIWDFARSCDEINETMFCELDVATVTGLLSYYDFNQGINAGNNSLEGILFDVEENNDGILTNFTLTGTTSNWVDSDITGFSTTACGVSGSYPEILVTGNSIEIINNDASPELADNTILGITQIGTTISKDFVIENTGSATLNISDITLLTTPSDFVITSPIPLTIAGGSSVSITVEFTPTTAGFQTNGIIITTDDCDEDTYTFAIVGGGVLGAPGGATADLQLWLKANEGTNNTTNGADITSWNDQSVNLYTANEDVSGTDAPTYNTSSINFNPAVSFDGTFNNIFSDGLHLGSDHIYSTQNGMTIFSVVKPNAGATDQYLFDFGAYDNEGYGLGYGTSNIRMYSATNTGGSDNTFVHSKGDLPALLEANISFADGQQYAYIDGTLVGSQAITLSQLTASEVAELDSYQSAVGGPVSIGRQSKFQFLDSDRIFDGDIAEVIVFNNDLGLVRRRQVMSYLALKYGITIDQSTATNYLSTDATIRMWDASTAGIYNQNIAGIGRDDFSGLNQKQSQSIENGIFTIALGTYATTNAGNTNTFPADKQFLVWADNGGSIAFADGDYANVPATVNFRMDRVWKVEENNGDVGNLEIRFPYVGLADYTCGNVFDLLVDDDGDFSNATVISPSALTPSTAFYNLNLADGQYFTFALKLSEIQVIDNITNTEIINGDLVPDILDNTDFGTVEVTSSKTNTYVINNLGNASLTLSGTPIVSLANDVEFQVTLQPASSISPTLSDIFEITFTPTTNGLVSDMVTISNSDCDEGIYTFSIQGTGCAEPVVSDVILFGINTTTSDEIISWDTSADADGYVIVMNTVDSFTPLNLGDNPVASTIYTGGEQVIYNGTSISSLTIVGLSPNTEYFYKIFPYKCSGRLYNNSSLSVADATLPLAPTAVTASNITNNSFEANWTIISGVSEYILDVSEDNFISFVPGYDGLSIGGTNQAVTGLSGNTNYQYRVLSVGILPYAYESEYSNIINVLTLPDAPVATDASTITPTSFIANWDAMAGITDYRLDVATDANFTNFVSGYNNLLVSGTTSQIVTGLVTGNLYFYRVRAVNASGDSEDSNTIEVIAFPNTIATPTEFSVIPISTGEMSLTWIDNAIYEDAYFVERKIGNNGTYELIATLGIDAFSYDDGTISEGQTYFYRVRAGLLNTVYSDYTRELGGVIGTPTSLEDELSSENLKVYPNPSSAIFNIEIENEYYGSIQMKVFNTVGEELLTKEFEKKQKKFVQSLDLANYPSGSYMLIIQADKARVVKKLLKD